ncbi:MAG TPA: hypothetical protein VD978_22880 [Azospirillum sp.]|nr:hypothetical protein [Azospirillum sp.]
MFDSGDFGRITADEQVDALHTLIAVFSTSVQRPGHPARNAVTAEILDILDEVPGDRAEPVAQLFTMMAMRLRRRTRRRSTIFRQAIETALLARSYHGAEIPDGEGVYLQAERPSLTDIESACGELLERLEGVPEDDRSAWITAEVIAAALVHAEGDQRLGGPDRDVGDLAVAEFLLRTTAQYLAATAQRGA